MEIEESRQERLTDTWAQLSRGFLLDTFRPAIDGEQANSDADQSADSAIKIKLLREPSESGDWMSLTGIGLEVKSITRVFRLDVAQELIRGHYREERGRELPEDFFVEAITNSSSRPDRGEPYIFANLGIEISWLANDAEQ